MALKVDTDPDSGFCGGVIRAIGNAEKFLSEHPDRPLHSLGAIVHNEEELSRLSLLGLDTVEADELDALAAVPGATLLIRAHGEPPVTYERAEKAGLEIVDCTCPVVLKLQKDIVEAYKKLSANPRGGQIVIFGKIGHAEVNGLVGQADGDAIVVEDEAMLRNLISDGSIRLDVPIELFSQTTKSPDGYERICSILSEGVSAKEDLRIHNTICSQVATRHKRLSEFALAHDIIIFVSGKMSSNGAVLFDLCKSLNIRTFHIGSSSELRKEWFRPDDNVGVCGATSTPKWLLEQVAGSIENFAK